MKQRLTSAIAARQKRHSTFLSAYWIVGVLCIVLISAIPGVGSANQSPADLSAQTPSSTPTVELPPTIMVPTYTTTPTPTWTATITASPTWTPTHTQVPSVTPSKVPPPNDPIGSQQILVSSDDVLYVYTQTGELLESYEIPYPVEPRPISEYARDIIPGPNKTIFVYNGTFDPYLSILDRGSGTWTHTTHDGWSTANNLTYGGIGKFSKYVYLTDMYTNGNEECGILRFNVRDASFDRYALDHNWNNLTIGLDNLVYALSSNTREVSVLDPLSMQILRGFRLTSTVSYIFSLVVDNEGDIYGVDSNRMIRHYDNNGLLLDSVAIGAYLSDIDISENGQFVVSGRYGDIILLDENLVIQNRFTVEGGYISFVAFLPAH